MVRKLFHSFVFLAPFTSFFALSAWIRLPVAVNQFLFLITIVSVLIYGKVKTRWILKEDLYLLSFLGIVWLSFLLGFKERRSFNHALAYTNAIIFFYLLSKYVVNHLTITSRQIAKTVYYSFITSSIIILTDFIGINYLNFGVREIYSVVDGKTSNMDYYIRGGLKRVGGVAEEPGTMALFYNVYFGITLYFLTLNKYSSKIKYVIIIYTLSHFAMLSNAGITLGVFSLIAIFMYEKLKRNKISKKQINRILLLTVSSLIIMSVLFISDVENIRVYSVEFFNKITFSESESVTSSKQRIFGWKRAWHNFISHPIFGYGPGYGVHENNEGYLSVYLTILADIGFIGLGFFVAFQQAVFKRALQVSSKVRPFILFSLVTSFLHLLIVSDFYHAPVWILLMWVQVTYFEEKRKQI